MITGICSREERKNVLTRKRKRFKSCRQKGEKGSPGSIIPAECFPYCWKSILPFPSESRTYRGSCLCSAAVSLAVLGALYLIEVSVVQTRLVGGIHEAGRKMALLSYGVYGGISEEEKGTGVGEIVDGALTAVYAKNLILKKAGLEETFLKEQVKISLAASDFSEKNIIDLKVMSRISLPVPGYRLRRLKFLERGRVRAWTGRSPSEEMAEGEETEGETVYVALNGSVYHRDPDCSYIKVSIKSASVAEMERKRSSDGSKYYPCSCYGAHPSPTVYYTRFGNRYHGSLGCSALKRTAQKVPLSSVSGWKACSKCG